MPLTWWQLETMAIGRMDEMWNHTASILATVINCHRDPKRSSAARPDELRPTFRRNEPVEYAEFSELAGILQEHYGFQTTHSQVQSSEFKVQSGDM